MFLNTSSRPYSALTTRSLRPQLAAIIALVFSAGLVAGTCLPGKGVWQANGRDGGREPAARSAPIPGETTNESTREATAFGRDGHALLRQPVDVLRTIDGDTFEARVHPWPGLEIVTRVRLRGVDAPELKARCSDELQMAQAASEALRALLAQGGVTIFNIGPDKYNGRVVADVATRMTPNVSAALLASGQVRRYGGGHREGWCASAFGSD